MYESVPILLYKKITFMLSGYRNKCELLGLTLGLLS